MKVLLVDPPFGAEEVGGERGSFAAVRNIIPALGLAYLAAVAEAAGHEVRIVDCARGGGLAALTEELRAFPAQVVGVTATTPTFANACAVARVAKAEVSGTITVCGGPHPTVMPAAALAAGCFDYLVCGEGELTFVELLTFLAEKNEHAVGTVDGAVGTVDAPVETVGTACPGSSSGEVKRQSVDEIAGLAFLRNGAVVQTVPRPLIDDLDSLPHPARHLLPPLTAYAPTPASYRHLPLAHIMTSRGCPSRCKFCDRGIFGESFRARSAADVLAEVDEVIERGGAREIRFFDDTFTLDRKRLAAILAGMQERKIPWTCLTKVNAVNPELLAEMAAAGCWQVLYGLESGDDEVLASLGKGTTVAENRQAVLWASEAGLRVRADFIVGTPHETMESLERTVRFALSLPLDFAHFNKFVPFPGTEFYRQLVEEGHRFDFSGSSSTLDHDALVYVPPAIPEAQYRTFLDSAYRRFFLRPTFILRRLFAMRTMTELWGHVKGFTSIWSM